MPNEIERKWWKEAVVYQIYPRSFKDSNGDGIGDLKGITEKLDYLKLLGIDVIWLSPVYQSPNDDNGYDISDYRAIMQEFGTMEDFDQMLREAHRRGIKIVMDLVVNHTSDEHQWFIESRKAQSEHDGANPYKDFYIWRSGKSGEPPNNWGSLFSGSAWKYDELAQSYYLHIFSQKQPDLNWDNPEVRHEVYAMMRFWLDKGVDGFRMDVINLISKTERFPDGAQAPGIPYGDPSPFCVNGPRVHEYLQEMNREVLSKYDIITVGETPMATVEDARRYTNIDGSELNMVFQFEHVNLDHGKFGKWDGESFRLRDLKKTMSRWQEGLYGSGWNSLYWENHDQPRSVSRFGDDSTPLMREKSAKMLGVCLHLMQGTPYIYQGQELGMTNAAFDLSEYRDIEILNAYRELVTERKLLSPDAMMRGIHRKGRDNARFPFQWDSSLNGGFSTGTPWIKVNPNYRDINAASQIEDAHSVFNFYRKLIALRKQHRIILYGKYRLLDDGLTEEEQEKLYVYAREYSDAGREERLLVICSFSKEETPYRLPEAYTGRNRELLIANYPVTGQETAFSLRPYECRVYLI
jgi:oligo-1,6-glucosidase